MAIERLFLMPCLLCSGSLPIMSGSERLSTTSDKRCHSPRCHNRSDQTCLTEALVVPEFQRRFQSRTRGSEHLIDTSRNNQLFNEFTKTGRWRWVILDNCASLHRAKQTKEALNAVRVTVSVTLFIGPQSRSLQSH
jgi:hypothetical protein